VDKTLLVTLLTHTLQQKLVMDQTQLGSKYHENPIIPSRLVEQTAQPVSNNWIPYRCDMLIC